MQSRRIRVRGQVQGVGFRPFIWQLAHRMRLRGRVHNDPEGVLIYAAGENLDGFQTAIKTEAPPLARVELVEGHNFLFDAGMDFVIAETQGKGAETRVTPDAATCPACLDEIRDPNDRRFGYPFANCTHCGPRFTILNQLPYDRGNTTMSDFTMCAACQSEYDDPSDRRFHAQPIACPDCGPKLWAETAAGKIVDGDAILLAREWLENGAVVAVKGLGGFHLACDATNAEAVATLRARKHRPAKPFALMGTQEMIGAYAALSEVEAKLLADPAAPIVLLEKVGKPLPDAVAPGQSTLGWMLPSTPLHHLLLDKTDRPLVMTSGNISGEPQVIGNDEAREKLGKFVDGFLMHDREIARRLDDSVERILPWGRMVLRRARGRVPDTLPLPRGFETAPQIVAYGGEMKSAICLVKNGQALLGHHLGELSEALTYEAFLQADQDYAALFDHQPKLAACDAHPEFRATQYAKSKGLPLIEVQHHHAHLASCLAENAWPLAGGQVAGIILDGIGLGTDGTVWGGEVLVGDYHGFERHSWLHPAPLIGGDMASREPWRNALVRLDQAGLSEVADELFSAKPLSMARMAVEKGINAPLCSSVGRLFDAVAAILGICADTQSYEGEAAMRVEAIASGAAGRIEFDFIPSGDGPLDPTPVIHALVTGLKQGEEISSLAFAFHKWLARVFAYSARALVKGGHAKAVALSGGCMQNVLLAKLLLSECRDVPVLIHSKVPANDGGLALGQVAIAAARAVSD